MSRPNQRKSRGFAIYIGILTVLLMLAVALFIYASATNGVKEPRLPGGTRIAPTAWYLPC